ncbi:helix-turn-helix transcriptional regulator, partial [Candidatus Woesearchaeota archaeon]|nr:helix-turn-helix transcriptional regulator [Candidatus Woesearchaeota archaeon]
IKILLNRRIIFQQMPKSNFLLVDLNEAKTKKLAETITSDTSRKILNYLADKEHDTEQNVSNFLKLPISTVHYHLQKLTEAKLVEIQEFHYSVKGREVNHYQLANKYIIIAPGKVSGLKQKLKGLLPAALAAAGISAVIKVIQSNNLSSTAKIAAEAGPEIARALDSTVQPAQSTLEASLPTIALAPDLALWFLIGSIAALALYLLIEIIREKFK